MQNASFICSVRKNKEGGEGRGERERERDIGGERGGESKVGRALSLHLIFIYFSIHF